MCRYYVPVAPVRSTGSAAATPARSRAPQARGGGSAAVFGALPALRAPPWRVRSTGSATATPAEPHRHEEETVLRVSEHHQRPGRPRRHHEPGPSAMVVVMCAMLMLVLLAVLADATQPGCYDDGVGKPAHRLLPYMPYPNMDPVIDATTCNAACAAKNYTLGGLEAGHACFCGHELVQPVGSLQPMIDCCTPCVGDASQACGGDNKLLVFNVGHPPARAPSICPGTRPVKDPRHIRKGVHMLTQGYLDQPYCVTMKPKKHDPEKPGRWICTITGSMGGEGSAGEHVQTLYSDDSGATWSDPVSVEPSPINTELANAYSVILAAPGMAADGGERVYTLYNMNVHNVTAFPPTVVSGNTTVAGIEAPVAYDVRHVGAGFDGIYVRCSSGTTTMPCAAAYSGDEWNQAPVYALRSEQKTVDHKNRTIYHVLIRDTGVWRLADVTNDSAHDRELQWPGRAVYECKEKHAGGVVPLPPARGWTRVEDEHAVRLEVIPANDTLPGAKVGRTDCQGYFVMRYSDDGAESWSKERILVPYRVSAVDLANDWKGKVREMWTVDQIKIHKGTAYFAFTKIAHYLLEPAEEMWILASHNILTERNASLVKWNLLPDGEHGLPPPFRNTSQEDTIIEESHILPLDGPTDGFYMLGRTTLGYLAASWTAGATAARGWRPTQYAQYWDPSHSENVQQLHPLSHSRLGFGGVAPDGAGLKNPRGPVTARKITAGPLAGLYLLLYYNNACQDYASAARNPYWLTIGRRAATDPEAEHAQHQLLWAQPEIVLYDTIRDTHPGYPDIIQDPTDAARIVITETQKTISRLHEIPHRILRALETQHSVRSLAPEEGARRIILKKEENVMMLKTPEFGNFSAWAVPHMGDGFTIGLVVQRHSMARPGDILIDSRESSEAGKNMSAGVAVMVSDQRGLVLTLSDGKTLVELETDAACTEALDSAPNPGNEYKQHHFVGFVVDAGPRILRVLVDGVLCDGGAPSTKPRPLGTPEGHGYAIFDPLAGDIRGDNKMRLAPSYGGEVVELQLYERALLTSELVGNYRHCCVKETREEPENP